LVVQEKNIQITVEDEVKDYLAKQGRDPLFWARPLKRAIQNTLLDALAMDIIEGNIGDGDKIVAKMEKWKIVLSKIS
jgi:ATP-dependent Clp protease ATP-binding subunit ClpB